MEDFVNRTSIALKTLALLFAGSIWSRADLAAEQVTVHNPSFDISVITLFVAKEKGYFREEGLEPLFILATPGVGINGLIAGSFDFSAAGGSASTAMTRSATWSPPSSTPAASTCGATTTARPTGSAMR